MNRIGYDDLLGTRLDQDDTCDRCGPGVAAYAAVRLPSGLKLTFCNHCLRKHATALSACGATATTAKAVAA